jgi:hypothetical protein
MKTAMHLCELHALMAFDGKRKEEVSADVRMIFRMSDSLSKEPCMISSLVRLVILREGCRMIENAINTFSFSDQELKGLDEQLAAIDPFAQLLQGFHYERVVVSDLFKNPSRVTKLMKESSSEAEDSSFGSEIPILWVGFKATGMWQRDFLYYLKVIDQLERVCALPRMERLEAVQNIEDDLIWEKEHAFRAGGFKLVSGMFLPSLTKAVKKHMREDVLVQLTRCGIAVERFRLKNGKLPASLEEIVPDFLAGEQMDPFSGEPMQFETNEEGYVIYSVGQNGEDDGGKVSSKKLNEEADDIAFTRVMKRDGE